MQCNIFFLMFFTLYIQDYFGMEEDKNYFNSRIISSFPRNKNMYNNRTSIKIEHDLGLKELSRDFREAVKNSKKRKAQSVECLRIRYFSIYIQQSPDCNDVLEWLYEKYPGVSCLSNIIFNLKLNKNKEIGWENIKKMPTIFDRIKKKNNFYRNNFQMNSIGSSSNSYSSNLKLQKRNMDLQEVNRREYQHLLDKERRSGYLSLMYTGEKRFEIRNSKIDNIWQHGLENKLEIYTSLLNKHKLCADLPNLRLSITFSLKNFIFSQEFNEKLNNILTQECLGKHNYKFCCPNTSIWEEPEWGSYLQFQILTKIVKSSRYSDESKKKILLMILQNS